jgi:hypothetical protein
MNIPSILVQLLDWSSYLCRVAGIVKSDQKTCANEQTMTKKQNKMCANKQTNDKKVS